MTLTKQELADAAACTPLYEPSASEINRIAAEARRQLEGQWDERGVYSVEATAVYGSGTATAEEDLSPADCSEAQGAEPGEVLLTFVYYLASVPQTAAAAAARRHIAKEIDKYEDGEPIEGWRSADYWLADHLDQEMVYEISIRKL